ncbi:SnoaL-like domain-containing protein, partial [Klenkia terrae]
VDPTHVADQYLQVWNTTDPEARATVATAVFADDVSYVDPLMAVTGREALVEAIGAVHGQFPGFTFRPAGPADGHHDQVRFGWELGPEGTAEAPVAGFDVAVLDASGRIVAVHGFLDRVPV